MASKKEDTEPQPVPHLLLPEIAASRGEVGGTLQNLAKNENCMLLGILRPCRDKLSQAESIHLSSAFPLGSLPFLQPCSLRKGAVENGLESSNFRITNSPFPNPAPSFTHT